MLSTNIGIIKTGGTPWTHHLSRYIHPCLLHQSRTSGFKSVEDQRPQVVKVVEVEKVLAEMLMREVVEMMMAEK